MRSSVFSSYFMVYKTGLTVSKRSSDAHNTFTSDFVEPKTVCVLYILTLNHEKSAHPGACMRPMMAVEEERPHTRQKMLFCACAGSDVMTQRNAS